MARRRGAADRAMPRGTDGVVPRATDGATDEAATTGATDWGTGGVAASATEGFTMAAETRGGVLAKAKAVLDRARAYDEARSHGRGVTQMALTRALGEEIEPLAALVAFADKAPVQNDGATRLA